jgi:anti-sigma factor RsiW
MANEHELDWNDRLQELLDGELAPAERAAVEAHVATCTTCQEQLADLRVLDGALRDAAPKISLDENFDARLFSQITAHDEARRIAARQRAQAELESQLAQLTQNWRRRFGIVLPSIVAGIALAFCIAAYFGTTDWARALTAEGAAQVGATIATLIRVMLTSVIGAAIGYIVARWLTPIAES